MPKGRQGDVKTIISLHFFFNNLFFPEFLQALPCRVPKQHQEEQSSLNSCCRCLQTALLSSTPDSRARDAEHGHGRWW